MANNKRSSRLYIGSLGASATQSDIEELFSKYGTITEVRMNRNFAFVQYTNEDSAAAALGDMNGTSHFGRNLDVQFARAPRISAGGGGGDKKDDNGRDRSPIGNRGGGSGRGGPPGGRGSGGFGDDSPFGGPNRGGPFNDRDSGSFGGRDGGRDFGGRGGPEDRFGGGRGDFDRGGPGGRDFDRGGPGGRDFGGSGPGGRDFGNRDPWAGPGGRDRGSDWDRLGGGGDRDRPDPWKNGPSGRGGADFRDGPDFRGGADSGRGASDLPRGDFRDQTTTRHSRSTSYPYGPAGQIINQENKYRSNYGPQEQRHRVKRGQKLYSINFNELQNSMELDRDFGRGGPDRGLEGLGARDFRDRGPDFGRDRGGGSFGRDDDFGGRPGGFRDDPPFGRNDRDLGRDNDGRGGPPPPVWAQRDKPPNSDPVPLNTPNAERTNDIEIIVLNKSITDYGEYIETRLKSIGFSVDIMFPNESAPIPRVLGNIASRGTLYAIIVNPAHKLNRSLTLQVLHGTPQEHRNMLIEDAIIFLNRNFENYSKSMAEKRGPNAPPEQVRHLLELIITASRQLTTTQFDILIQYFINEKMKVEPPVTQEPIPVTQQAELQTRILSILNKNSVGGVKSSVGPTPLMNISGLVSQPAKSDSLPEETPSPLLKDPSVQRALDSLMQGGSNLFNTFGSQNRF